MSLRVSHLLETEDAERLWRRTSRKQIKLPIRGGQKGQESDEGGITSIKVHWPKGTQVPPGGWVLFVHNHRHAKVACEL